MHTYHTPLDLVRERSPERPVALVRRGAVALAARWFQEHFKGDVLYAVKANPAPWVIRELFANGVTSFDAASIAEIELVRAHAPGACSATSSISGIEATSKDVTPLAIRVSMTHGEGFALTA